MAVTAKNHDEIDEWATEGGVGELAATAHELMDLLDGLEVTIAPEEVDAYIRSLNWTSETQAATYSFDEMFTLVAGNIRGFASMVRASDARSADQGGKA